MLLIDTGEGRIISDTEIKQTLAAEHPYGDWLRQHLVDIEDLPERGRRASRSSDGAAAAAGVWLHARGPARSC